MGKAIRCPYCGDGFSIETGWEGGPYSGHEVIVGFECENFECDASWDTNGNPVRDTKIKEQGQ